MHYTIEKGFANEITLSNGKKYYTGVGSLNSLTAKQLNLVIKPVEFEGCCIDANIMDRAKSEQYFPIKINGVDIHSYIESVADENEPIK